MALVTVGRQVLVRIPLRVPLGPERIDSYTALLVEGPAGWGEVPLRIGMPIPAGALQRGHQAARAAAHTPWPAPVRASIRVNGLVPAVGPDEAARLTAEAVAAGIDTMKVKVGGGGIDADVDRLAAVRGVLGPAGKLRVDANGAWDVDTALLALARLDRYDLELAEQPVAALDDLARLRRLVPVPLAADEAVRTLAEADALGRLGAADVLVVKVAPTGGVAATLELVEAAGVPAIVSSMYETSVGLAAGLAVAACLPEDTFAHGLGTATLLAGDVVTDPLVPRHGVLEVRRPVPDEALLARYRVADGVT